MCNRMSQKIVNYETPIIMSGRREFDTNKVEQLVTSCQRCFTPFDERLVDLFNTNRLSIIPEGRRDKLAFVLEMCR